MDKEFIIDRLNEIKRFLKCNQCKHNIYGLHSAFLESPSEEIIRVMYEKDQKDLETIIHHLKEVL